MKIKTQLVISMVVFGLALLIIAVSMITTGQQVNRLNGQGALAKDIQLQVSELSYLSNDYLLYNEGQQADRWDSKFSLISDDVSNLSVDTADQQVLVNDLKDNRQRLKDVFSDVEAQAGNVDQSQDHTLDRTFIQVSWSRIDVQIEEMIFDASRLSQKLDDEADQQKQINELLVFALLGIFIIFLLTNYFLIYRNTLASIAELQAGTRIIGAGDLDFSIKEKKGNEFFELSHAFNLMTARLKTVTASKADLEKEVAERKRAEFELQQKQEELEAQAEELQSQAEELSANNEELGKQITERRHTEEVLQTTMQRFYTILSGMYAGILLVSEDDRVEFANQAFCDYFGLKGSPSDFVGITSSDMIEKIRNVYLDPDEAVAHINEIVSSGQPEKGEEVAIQGGRTCLRDFIPLDVDGKPYGRLWLHTDIADRKRSEEAVRETSNYLESLINYANAPIIVWGTDFKITRFNHAFERLTGYDSDEVVGKELDLLFPQESKDESLVKIKRTLAGEYWESAEIPILRKDGKTRIALWNSANIYGKDGNTLIATIAQGQDITERKQAEKELLSAKMQAELYLDLMGHDISNMHQIAMGQLELAQEIIKTDGRLEAADREMIDTSLDSLWRSARLIDNVRKLQKIRSDEVKNIEISLDEILAGVVNQYSGHNTGKAIKVDAGEESHIVKANELLRDVFTNLIGNAIKHSNGSNTEILVKVEDAQIDGKKHYKVSIEDNGPGIPDDMKDSIFNRLQRGETKARGMGLGLYLVRSLVESYHGNVWVEDRIQGDHTKGSRFVVMLPAIDQ